jgi:hypothetical protein
MSTDTIVEVEVLGTDASKYWGPWSERLSTMKGKVDTSLSSEEFSFIPGAGDVYTAFVAAQTRLEDYIAGGVTAFQAFRDLLMETSVEYLEEEGASAAEVAAFRAKYPL